MGRRRFNSRRLAPILNLILIVAAEVRCSPNFLPRLSMLLVEASAWNFWVEQRFSAAFAAYTPSGFNR